MAKKNRCHQFYQEQTYSRGEAAVALALANGDLNRLGYFFNRIPQLVESGNLPLYKKGSYWRFGVADINTLASAEAKNRLATINRFLDTTK